MTRSPAWIPPCSARVAPPETVVMESGEPVDPRAVPLAMVKVPELTVVIPSKVLGPERIWLVVPSLTRVPVPLMTPTKFVPGDASALEPTVKILPSRAMVDWESPAREAMAWSSPERLRVEPSSRARLLRPFSWGKASAALVFTVVPSVMRVGPQRCWRHSG